MDVYLAARFGRRIELLGYAKQLQQLGHRVTSTWLEVENLAVEDDGRTFIGDPGALAMLAVMDYRDIEEADLLIAFGEPAAVPVRGRLPARDRIRAGTTEARRGDR